MNKLSIKTACEMAGVSRPTLTNILTTELYPL